jgi:acyl-CoA synthetase (AMP-forming)/AMP-acid ligase II
MALPEEIRTLSAMLLHRARWSPDGLAFQSGAETLTFRHLAADAKGLAGGLGDLGVRRGDRVGVFLSSGLDFVRMFYAIQLAGGVPCAYDPATPAVTATRRAAALAPALVVVEGEPSAEVAAGWSSTGLKVSTLAAIPRVPWAGSIDGDDSAAAYLQPTSGTSGEPRLAVITQRNVLVWHRGSRDSLDPAVYRVLVSWVPPWHDLGLVRFVIGSVYLGSPCHLVPAAIRTLPLWLETIAKVGGTLTGAPDFAYRLAVRMVDGSIDLSTLCCAINGGEAVRASTIAAFESRFRTPGAVRPGYGLAEATLGATVLIPGEALRVDARGNVSCGRPRRDLALRIGGSTPGPGEILMQGPTVFAGYLGAEEATKSILRDGWLHSGDIGGVDTDGHLYVLGRERALLKRGGVSLAPRELEEPVEALKGVRLAAAIGMRASEQQLTDGVAMIVESDETARPEDLIGAIVDAVAGAVGFIPEQVVVLRPRSIPRTRNGKLRHAVLGEALADGSLQASGAVLLASVTADDQRGAATRARSKPRPMSSGW